MSTSSSDAEVRATWLTLTQEYKFQEFLSEPGSQLGNDPNSMVSGIMVKGAQLRMTNASFPQELRLQVMKASVLYHSPTFNISSATQSRTDDFVHAVGSLFDKQQTSGALYDTLRELAEQALFETAIFKVQKCISQIKLGALHSTAPLLDEVGGRVQHLELIAHVFPALSWQATLKEATKVWKSLKHQLPNLKACVLSAVFRSYKEFIYFGGNANGGYYASSDQTPFPKELVREGSMPGESLGSTLTKLFAEFMEKGPGVRRFVRIQQVQFDLFTDTVTPHYGPLVAVRSTRTGADAQESSSGASMLNEAYRLVRSGKKSEHTFGAYDVQY
ncbi:hypothetical protein MBLNU13_g09105t2 [Cladosporium sp. NU13]